MVEPVGSSARTSFWRAGMLIILIKYLNYKNEAYYHQLQLLYIQKLGSPRSPSGTRSREPMPDRDFGGRPCALVLSLLSNLSKSFVRTLLPASNPPLLPYSQFKSRDSSYVHVAYMFVLLSHDLLSEAASTGAAKVGTVQTGRLLGAHLGFLANSSPSCEGPIKVSTLVATSAVSRGLLSGVKDFIQLLVGALIDIDHDREMVPEA